MIQPHLLDLIEQHVATIQRADLETLAIRLPDLRAGLRRYDCPSNPSLPNQIEFLAFLIEDTGTGLNGHLPLTVLAHAAFALNYLQREQDLIPDDVAGAGLLDDAMVVSMVLQRHQAFFQGHPRAYKLRWPVPPVRFEAGFARGIRALVPQPSEPSAA